MPLRFLASGLAAVAAATLSALLGALTLSRLSGVGVTPPLAAIALGLGAFAGGVAFWQLRDGTSPDHSAQRPATVSIGSWIMFVVFGLFALRVFPWLLYAHGDRLEFLSPNNTGDLPRHLLYGRYFASGAPWWPENPLHAWAPLRYYAGIDLFQSLLLSVGVPEIPGLVWVGLFGSAATALALWRWGGAFALAGFLFSGGLAGFAWLQTGVFLDYQKDLAWKNLALAIFVTQRGFLFALPAGLLLLSAWRERFFGEPEAVADPSSAALPANSARSPSAAVLAGGAALHCAAVFPALRVFVPVRAARVVDRFRAVAAGVAAARAAAHRGGAVAGDRGGVADDRRLRPGAVVLAEAGLDV